MRKQHAEDVSFEINLQTKFVLVDKLKLQNKIEKDYKDFYIHNFRFIHQSVIFNVLLETFETDAYALGIFKPEILKHYVCLSENIIKGLQKSGQEELIGWEVINHGDIEGLVKEYLDGRPEKHKFDRLALTDGQTRKISPYYFFKIG